MCCISEEQLNRRKLMEMPEYRKWITSNPNVLFGKPAIRDTRIPVELILDELAGA